MSYSPTTALRVEIKPSNYFCAALIGSASLALAAIFYTALSWPLRLLFVLIVLIYSGFCWHSQIRQHGILQWRSTWSWRDMNGSECALRLQHCTVWPGLIVLRFRDAQRRRNVVFTLFADSFLDAKQAHESSRRLRVYLNHFPVFTVDTFLDGSDAN